MSLKIDEIIKGEFFHLNITGRLYVLELIHAIQDLVEGQYQYSDTVNELWDLTEAEYSHLSFHSAEELSKEILSKKMAFKPGKVAILVNDNAEKYLVTYLSGLLENNSVRTINVFYSRHEAYNFLGYELPRD